MNGSPSHSATWSYEASQNAPNTVTRWLNSSHQRCPKVPKVANLCLLATGQLDHLDHSFSDLALRDKAILPEPSFLQQTLLAVANYSHSNPSTSVLSTWPDAADAHTLHLGQRCLEPVVSCQAIWHQPS